MGINFLSEATLNGITPTRSLNLLYIILDTVFLLFFIALLVWKKRYATLVWALFGGILYVLVDFGGFYLVSHTREVYIDGQLADIWGTWWVLLWMSMSYGITNFAWIWVCLAKDKYWKLWVMTILIWWLIAPSIAELGGEATIMTYRTTDAYHGIMGIFMVVSYFALIVVLLYKKRPFVNVLILFAVGFSVQFGWEFSLLINGIRPMNEESIRTLIVNSCLETNLGLPSMYLIYWAFDRKWNEDFSRKVVLPVSEA